MRIFKKLGLVLLVISLLLIPFKASAQSTEDILNQLREQIEQYEREIGRLRSQANTLSNQIAQFDAQIRLTTLRIAETQEKITFLGGRIDQLEVSLEALTKAFSSRASETYKMTRLGDPLIFLISAPDLSSVVSRYHYLQRIQEADRDLLIRLQQAQNVYQGEKEDQEDLQEQLEEQSRVLGAQKTAKAELLSITKNDERKYQELLAKARAELAAIQAIIAGKGEETKVKDVNEGERIASILTYGPNLYACSTGPHLHFEVAQNQVAQNPFSLLSGKSLIWENTDLPQNGTGSWIWPLNDPIRITQGFGQTSYSSRYAGGIHTGIDMTNKDNLEVKAVKRGTMYRGGIGCMGGTLQYVRVDHADDDYNTYYLHVSY